MARRIELTIDPEYVNWGIYEGVREFLQNAKDAETLGGHTMTVRHDSRRNVLQIRSAGAILTEDTLLLGRTQKRGNADAIGQFGEGYKLGCLGLVRKDVGVKIWTGDQMWEPVIAKSKNFEGCDVLAFDIHQGRKKGLDGVLIEIFNLGTEAWKDIKDLFLFLSPVPSEKMISTSRGHVLLDEKYRGRLYAKGIFVQTLPGDFRYGYDMVNLTLDRDRRVADHWSLRFALDEMWRAIVEADGGMAKSVYDMLNSDAPDTASVSAEYMDGDVKDALASEFKKRHGDAIPVASVGDSAKLAHVGKSGVVVSKKAHEVLSSILGKSEDVLDAAQSDAVAFYSWEDLLPVEQSNLQSVVKVLGCVREDITLDVVRIVDFRGEACLGQYREGAIYLARKILTDVPELIATIAHEFAHKAGGDGTVQHEREIERILSVALTAAIGLEGS